MIHYRQHAALDKASPRCGNEVTNIHASLHYQGFDLRKYFSTSFPHARGECRQPAPLSSESQQTTTVLAEKHAVQLSSRVFELMHSPIYVRCRRTQSSLPTTQWPAGRRAAMTAALRRCSSGRLSLHADNLGLGVWRKSLTPGAITGFCSLFFSCDLSTRSCMRACTFNAPRCSLCAWQFLHPDTLTDLASRVSKAMIDRCAVGVRKLLCLAGTRFSPHLGPYRKRRMCRQLCAPWL